MKLKTFFVLSLRSILFIFSFILLVLFTGQQASSLTKWWSIIVSFCNIVTLIILLSLLKKEKTSYSKMIGYKKGRTRRIEIILISVGIFIFGIGGMYLAGYLCYGKFPYLAVTLIEPIPLWLAISNLFILPISTTLAEDGIYLGYSISRIDRKWLAILLPAFFYALQHSFIPIMLDAQYLLYRFLSFLPLTVLMCTWYYKKRNPVPLMVGHFIINLATVTQIIMTSAFPQLFEMMKNL